MSKMPLAVKYRPKDFEDLTEQASVAKILTYQISTGTNKNSYLFTGPAGTGKTTTARIFGTKLNDGVKNLIELDAASNNSVDDIRKIIDEAKFQDLSSKYKVYIIDECFPKGTKITLEDGTQENIENIKIGTRVKHMSGSDRVSYVFKNSIFTKNLCCIIINNEKIITTTNHLFFTDEGWVMAKDLRKGDYLYDTTSMSKLWKTIQQQEEGSKILLPSMFSGIKNEELCETYEESNLSNMWQRIYNSYFKPKENLFKDMQEQINIKVGDSFNELTITDGNIETIIRKNEEKQSNDEAGNNSKNVGNQRKKWNSSSMEWNKRGKWEIYNSSNSLMERIRNWMGIGISNYNKLQERRTSISYLLQSRPCFIKNENSNRGRWCQPQKEKQFIERFKENSISRTARVESIEIYKRGYNDELFSGSFSSEELSQEFVEMYDLEVENDHTYYANNILVHNCHMLSQGAWNALLKLLEEPPLSTIFILCTTDAQKIPKTILSRVQRYDFKKISYEGIIKRLIYILTEEQAEGNDLTYYPDAVEYIARISEGGMRDAITLLDKCLSYSKEITLGNVSKALDITDMSIMVKLTKSIYSRVLADVIEITEKIYQDGFDIKLFSKQYLTFIVNCIKYTATKNTKLTNLPNNIVDSLEQEKFALKFLTILMESLVKLNEMIKWETSPKTLLQAYLISLIKE